MLVNLISSNVIIDLWYNLNKYIQYKHVWKLFEVDWLHQHTVIALYRLYRNFKNNQILQYHQCLWLHQAANDKESRLYERAQAPLTSTKRSQYITLDRK